MWFIGLVIGGLLGGFLGAVFHLEGVWFVTAALGAVFGVMLRGRFDASHPRFASLTALQELKQRTDRLERDVARLRAARSAGPTAEEAWGATMAPGVAAEPALKEILRDEMPVVSTPATAATARVERPTTKPAVEPKVASVERSWLWRKLFGGNVLAKVGVVLLFFGVASGLKLAVEFGVFPPSVRLLLATVAGLAMIGFGLWRRADEKHRIFTLSLQGGGFALLYLVTYFALSWYRLIEPTAAFVLFGLLGFVCVATALLVEGELLAILGISGAFLAPILASTGKGSHVMLFSFYVLLNILVVTVNWLKSWRTLEATALLFTLGVGMMWAERSFVPGYFLSTQFFLVLFSVMFSANAALLAIFRRARLVHWAEIVMVFGTPVAAAVCETWLMQKTGFSDVALAWAAVAAGLYYAVLLAALHLTNADIQMQRAHLAIAIPFITVAVPLAFGAEVTTAFWAIEGLALVWMGLENRSRVALAFGYLIQVIAGLYFISHLQGIEHLTPILNGVYVGVVVVALCGAASAWITFRHSSTEIFSRETQAILSSFAMAWGLAWWVVGTLREINEFVSPQHEGALQVGTFLMAAWVLEAAGVRLAASLPRGLSLGAAAVALLWVPAESWDAPSGSHGNHPLHDGMIFATPLAFATLYGLVRRLERDGRTSVTAPAHLYGLWMLAVGLALEGVWVARELAPFKDLWRLLAWGVLPAAVALLSTFLVEKKLWPAAAQPKLYINTGIPWLLAATFAWAVYANIEHSGGGSGLPYVPVLSFFDLAQILVLYGVIQWMRAARGVVQDPVLKIWSALAAGSAFIWLSAMAMRIAHHWGAVPFESHALLRSGMAQSLLSILWTVMAIAIMISATRSAIRSRWFVGFGLLGVVGAKFLVIDVVNKGTVTWTVSLIGVGLLILAASYFSPTPPKELEGHTT